MDLTGKRVLVTGGAVRIGKAIVQTLQMAGAEVVVHYHNSKAKAEALSPFTVQANLQCLEDCEKLIKQAGSLDILINNASIFTKDSLPKATPKRIQQEFETNLFAPMELIRLFAKQAEPGGAVINLLDRRICCNDTTCAPYSLTKKALANLTQLAALEYAPNIRVNAIAPGPVFPPSESSTQTAHELAGNLPLENLPTAENIAETVLFLLQANSITGQIVYVDGGQHLLGNGV